MENAHAMRAMMVKIVINVPPDIMNHLEMRPNYYAAYAMYLARLNTVVMQLDQMVIVLLSQHLSFDPFSLIFHIISNNRLQSM